MIDLLRTSLVLLATAASLVQSQSTSLADSDGYTGYKLVVRGDGDSATFQSANTDTQVDPDADIIYGPPDVFLNASVHVGDIGIDVQDLKAKITLDAQVLSLLEFSAGVDISVERVNLVIKEVNAKVLLEARLGNLVSMVGNVLDSIDLNPIIATVGNTVAEIGDTVGGALNDTLGGGSGSSGGGTGSTTPSNSTTSAGLASRTVHDHIDRVLFSKNDYAGNTHTNRILTDDGHVVDQFLDNDGRVKGQQRIGDYSSEFSLTGEERDVTVDGHILREKEYIYDPFFGLEIRSLIHFDAQGRVVSTRVLSELSAGGTSTISGD